MTTLPQPWPKPGPRHLFCLVAGRSVVVICQRGLKLSQGVAAWLRHVGAKAEVHQVLFDMARAGIAVIVISSELPEVMAISDHIVTFREGQITGVMPAAEATEEKLMQRMALGAGEHHVHSAVA